MNTTDLIAEGRRLAQHTRGVLKAFPAGPDDAETSGTDSRLWHLCDTVDALLDALEASERERNGFLTEWLRLVAERNALAAENERLRAVLTLILCRHQDEPDDPCGCYQCEDIKEALAPSEVTDTVLPVKSAPAQSTVAREWQDSTGKVVATEDEFDALAAENERMRAALRKIAQYDPRWTGAKANNAPNRRQLIETAFDVLAPSGEPTSEEE